jgi:hypothetical protein
VHLVADDPQGRPVAPGLHLHIWICLYLTAITYTSTDTIWVGRGGLRRDDARFAEDDVCCSRDCCSDDALECPSDTEETAAPKSDATCGSAARRAGRIQGLRMNALMHTAREICPPAFTLAAWQPKKNGPQHEVCSMYMPSSMLLPLLYFCPCSSALGGVFVVLTAAQKRRSSGTTTRREMPPCLASCVTL